MQLIVAKTGLYSFNISSYDYSFMKGLRYLIMIVQPKCPEQLVRLLKEKPLVLYGMGGAGMRIAEWCDSHEISYVFADRDFIKKQKETNKIVISPDELKKQFADTNIAVTSIIYCDEIMANLEKLGFRQEQILSYKIFMPEQDLMWSDLDDTIDWDLMQYRMRMISEWIDLSSHSIADYGAGQMHLKAYLKKEIIYYPIDYIRRTEETILCDFNQGSFPDLTTDTSVCCGVLEFIYTSEQLLHHICAKTTKQIIISYLTRDRFPSIEGRRASAYVSDLTENQIIKLMQENGYSLDKKVPDPVKEECTVFLFVKDLGSEVNFT